mmetsp:Transcript_26838/g.52509  ORF Transcript_26838/g.52509 Transcript_26838/m.52509 type:complete len:170 (-) Transcript_26838:39-548(-)|eukprot:CAMPEP_0172813198 /NCGR_PEP_ID=MMETSP1075-20121228/10509_1 /TAXON_ID=2916 /ORGANISM="Ceratium fusus, Strain PA161109" /LENGTH=169 /DNA_ID=CAMNT_0013652865 /DNA_START=47 /DNA_END=556 /DNA_ORIENTATION=+
MTQIFRIALLAALCLANCRSASIMQKGCDFAPRATLPLLLCLVPATLSSAEEAGEDAGKNEAAADEDIAGDADAEGGDGLEETEGDGAHGDEAEELNPAEILKDMDQDGDGFLSLAELLPDSEEIEENDKDKMQKAFAASDADKDGKLSVDELPALMKEFDGEDATEEM